MSLEIALAENTATMRQLIELLKGGAIAPAAEEPKKARKPRGEAPPEPETPKVEAKEPEAPVVEYKTVADAITRLAAKDRNAAIEILSSFGVKRGPDLKPEHYVDALAKLQAALQ
jgi:hypothetical protein